MVGLYSSLGRRVSPHVIRRRNRKRRKRRKKDVQLFGRQAVAVQVEHLDTGPAAADHVPGVAVCGVASQGALRREGCFGRRSGERVGRNGVADRVGRRAAELHRAAAGNAAAGACRSGRRRSRRTARAGKVVIDADAVAVAGPKVAGAPAGDGGVPLEEFGLGEGVGLPDVPASVARNHRVPAAAVPGNARHRGPRRRCLDGEHMLHRKAQHRRREHRSHAAASLAAPRWS